MDVALVALTVACVIMFREVMATRKALRLTNKNQIMLMLAMGEMAQQLGVEFNFQVKEKKGE